MAEKLMRKLQVETECDHTSAFGARKRCVQHWLSVAGILLCVLTGFPAAAQPNAKRILIIYSFSNRGTYGGLIDLKSELRAAIPLPINFYVEYLDGQRLGDEEYEKDESEILKGAYGQVKLDLVLLEDDPALEFGLKYRNELFPRVPIIFFDVDSNKIAGQKMPPGVTGVTAPVDVKGTINLALHLNPKTSTVAIITGSSAYERYWLERIHTALLHNTDRVKEVKLVGLPPNQLLKRVAALPPQTVVLFQLAPRESPQPAIGINNILAWVGKRFPTYSIFPRYVVGGGGIGGVGYDGLGQLSLVAEDAKQIFSGRRPENIPVMQGPGHQVKVDWRALRRWNIPESALPPGSAVFYQEPTLWERDRKYIIAALVLVLAQALLIAGLFWERARTRKAEAVLRESERRFRLLANTAPSLIWMCDAHGRITYLNERRIAFTGPDPDAGYGDTWSEYIHPNDLNKVLDTVSRALKSQQPFSREYRLRRNDGAYRWMFDVASPRVNGDGSFAGFVGSAIDTTDQKLAQEALQKVSGQLIEAQEKERSRIARELHDDICQRLALLSMELEQANRVSNGSPAAAKSNLEDIQKHCSEIASDVQSLSHQLHSSKLDLLGITGAIRGFCKELSKQHEVSIEFTDRNVPQPLSKDVSLCLFRVAQEALHNAVKYSGTSQFKVDLSATVDEVRLVVSDSGAGFNVEEAKTRRGLGLVSIQERMHLVNGTFSVDSKPGAGTKVIVSAPLSGRNSGTPVAAWDDQITNPMGTGVSAD
ncbi:MAG TPA: PAS domain-containing sensor histidine kinase [Acidobacteriaceae bacterium]|nr:PAS domain-containing sensor histidine kinase [Acidobacteriaceae bacterium]